MSLMPWRNMARFASSGHGDFPAGSRLARGCEPDKPVGIAFLLFHVVGEHPVNVVTVTRGDFHAGGAHFINSRVGVFFHNLVPSKSTGVNSIGIGRPSRSLTCLMWSSLLRLARWTQFQVSRKSQPWTEASARCSASPVGLCGISL